MKYTVQVDSNKYDFTGYVTPERWMSYYEQIISILDLAKKDKKRKMEILEIGIGNGLVANLLKFFNFNLTTFDIDPELKPTIVGSLPIIKIPRNKKFDLVVACEVLEHVQYKDAVKSLKRMAELAPLAVVSIPHKDLSISILVKLWFFRIRGIKLSIPSNFRTHIFNGEHYWELGTKDFSVEKFENDLSKSGWKITNDFRVIALPWHHFYILQRKNYEK